MPSLQLSSDPSNNVLEHWVDYNKDQSTVDKLLLFLEDLDRFDVIYEVKSLIGKATFIF